MRKIYITTAAIVFSIALLTQLPARVAWSWVESEATSNSVYLSGIQGTLSSGLASELQLQSIQIANPSWKFSYLPLLLGRIKLNLIGELDDYPLHTDVALLPTGITELENTQLALPLSLITALIQLPIMPLSGLLSVDMASMQISADRVISATGQAKIRNAQWLLMRPQLPLGELVAEISTRDDVVVADLSSKGPLLLKGTAQLFPDGHYEADLQLRSDTGADARLDNLLKALGKPVNGWYQIKSKGQIPG